MIHWILLYEGTPPLTLFGGTEGQGTPVVLDTLTDTPYYLKNGVVTPFASGGGSGTTITSGQTTVDFGAFPGTTDTSVAVTGQTAILAGSKVQAWILAEATADHSADEHLVDPPRLAVGPVTAGVGFTIYAFTENTRRHYGAYSVAWIWS